MPRKKKQPETTPETPVEETPVRRRRTPPKPEVDDALPVEVVEETPSVPEEEQETPETPQETPEITEREPETVEDELEVLDNQPEPEFVEPQEEPEEEPVSKPELVGEIPLDFVDPVEGPASTPKDTKYTRYTRRTTWKGGDRYGDAR